MNTWLGISEEIKTFFKEKVAKDFYLQLQETEDNPEMREPYVDLQSLPHKNFTPPDWIQPENSKPYHAPYVLIQTYNLRVNGDTVTMGVRAIFGVYASGIYENDLMADPSLSVPDNKAYVDLMLIIQKAIEVITANPVFGKSQLADNEIRADIYDLDHIWTYAYGYVEFDVQYFTQINSGLNL